MKNKLLFTAILATVLTFVSFETNQLFGQSSEATMVMKDTTMKYTCLHHPEVVSDKPGKCACGMDLVVMKDKDKRSKSTQMKEDKMMDNSDRMKNDAMEDPKGMKQNKMEKDSTMMKKGKM
jgi:hypothetical protein